MGGDLDLKTVSVVSDVETRSVEEVENSDASGLVWASLGGENTCLGRTIVPANYCRSQEAAIYKRRRKALHCSSILV